MNSFGQTLFVLALQVFLVAGVGLIASRRRVPASSCSPLVMASLLVLLLTPLAFLPRPTWQREAPSIALTTNTITVETTPTPTTNGDVGIDVLQLLRQLRKAPVAEPATPTRSAWEYWAWMVVGLAGIGLLRFLWAWRTVHLIVRAATPITDAALQQVSGELQTTLGCRRVKLRESTAFDGAATVGWIRPNVLLGSDWRQWTATQTRAVLAHELAHVRRRDYLTRLLATFASALHGYHPLVRWLVTRLEVQQELAADALAAPHAGGPHVYAQSLAALALKADARRLAMVPSFFTRPQTLLRRIGMLRVMDDSTTHPGRRWPALLAVGLVAVGALVLHGSSAEVFAEPIIKVAATETKRAPLDYTYLTASQQKDEVGVCVVRFGELVTMPGLDKFAEVYGDSVKVLLGDVGLPCELKELEQIGGRVSVSMDASKPPPNRHMSISLSFVRTTKDIDWVKYLKSFSKNWKEHTHADTTYYEAGVTIPLFPAEKSVWFYTPDKRTLVIESQDVIKTIIDAKKKPAAKPAWANQWSAVEGSMLVMVLPEPKEKLGKMLTPDKEAKGTEQQLIATYGSIINKTKTALISFDSGKECKLALDFHCATADDAISVDQACQKMTKLLDAELKDAPENVKKLQLRSMLRRGVHFDKEADHCVGLEMTAKGSLGDLIKAMMGSEK